MIFFRNGTDIDSGIFNSYNVSVEVPTIQGWGEGEMKTGWAAMPRKAAVQRRTLLRGKVIDYYIFSKSLMQIKVMYHFEGILKKIPLKCICHSCMLHKL